MKPAVIDRLGRRRGLAFVALLVQVAGLGCFVDVDLGGARLSCNDGQCPSGFECVDARCVEEGGGDGDGDDAAPQVDAAPNDPDAAASTDDAAPPDAAPPDAPLPTACEQQYGNDPRLSAVRGDAGDLRVLVNTEIAAPAARTAPPSVAPASTVETTCQKTCAATAASRSVARPR